MKINYYKVYSYIIKNKYKVYIVVKVSILFLLESNKWDPNVCFDLNQKRHKLFTLCLSPSEVFTFFTTILPLCASECTPSSSIWQHLKANTECVSSGIVAIVITNVYRLINSHRCSRYSWNHFKLINNNNI